MQHGGEPWVDLCVKLLLKWPNLHYMSSAFAPKRIPAPIMQLANSRGPDKVMWASDYPVLTFARCAGEIEEMPFKDEAPPAQVCPRQRDEAVGIAVTRPPGPSPLGPLSRRYFVL
jgi:predicted TIM-barrel fold metal-dependent hydrolase